MLDSRLSAPPAATDAAPPPPPFASAAAAAIAARLSTFRVGAAVGASVGASVGARVGDAVVVGVPVGAAVGAGVTGGATAGAAVVASFFGGSFADARDTFTQRAEPWFPVAFALVAFALAGEDVPGAALAGAIPGVKSSGASVLSASLFDLVGGGVADAVTSLSMEQVLVSGPSAVLNKLMYFQGWPCMYRTVAQYWQMLAPVAMEYLSCVREVRERGESASGGGGGGVRVKKCSAGKSAAARTASTRQHFASAVCGKRALRAY